MTVDQSSASGLPEFVEEPALAPVRCFVAYPAAPLDRAESIEKAITDINSARVAELIGWKTLKVSGRVVITAICDEIKRCDVFIADVTSLNPNVLFELGYAMAQRKRVWLLLNPKIGRAKADFDRFQLLSTVGYASYSNSVEITASFYKDAPYENLEYNLYEELLRSAGPASKKDALLYLRCNVETESSLRLARRVSSAPMKSVIDDPEEMSLQPFSWYVQQVASAFAIVCHFISSDYDDWALNNAKQALVSGLAHGTAKPLLMLAHEPYASPLDYRDLLRKHNTAVKAEAIFGDWLLPCLEQYEKRITTAKYYQADEKAQFALRDITIGEPVAEFESDSIVDYYVGTSTYAEAKQAKYSIVVGRKGAGKTATMFKLTEDLSADPRNHVCVIKPVGYELEGLLSILHEESPRAEQGYLVESFWKFLLYTELTKSVYDQLLAKPEYYMRTKAESALCEFIEQYKSLIVPEFSSRLESAVARLRELPSISTAEGRRLKLSELLHHEMLSRLRILLGNVLEIKARVTVMVDNLDKAWDTNVNLRLLSDLLFGLLSVSKRVAEDFARDASRRAPVGLFFVLFLRSDIYAAMLQFAKERDKLPVRLIIWDDPDLLKRIIEERFIKSGADIQSGHQVWEKYFVPTVAGIPTWDYIVRQILPRPRDLIYLVKSALQSAVNGGRPRIEEKDFVAGEKRYSRFALDSLVVEAGARIPKVEDFLLLFVQSPEVITELDFRNKLIAAKVPDDDLQLIISLFGELTFIGFEASPNRFEYLYDEQNAKKLYAMAQKTAAGSTGGARRFRIHPAFHAFLEIQPSVPPPS